MTTAAYEVELYYTCAPNNVGARIELTGPGGQVSTQIHETHDPPPLGAENDRFARQESYVKDFRAITMGELTLSQGEGQLVLKSVEIPGDESIEFRLLTLRRIEE